MRNETYSLRMPDHIIEKVDSRIDKKQGQSRSTRLVQDLEDYYSLLDYGLRSAKRKLTRKQAKAILDTMNSTAVMPGDMARWAGELISGRGDVAAALTHELADACDLDGLHIKWGLDREGFLHTVDALSPLEHAALVDWTKQVWASYDSDFWEKEISQFRPDQDTE